MSERKHCGNCKFENHDSNDEPCVSCDGTHIRTFTNWEPKEVRTGKEPSKSLIQDDYVVVKKEEKKMDNRKTKAQLMEELEQKNSEIAALKKELERSENYELFVTAGKEMRDAMDGLVAGGLTEEQAFQFVLAGAQLAARRRI